MPDVVTQDLVCGNNFNIDQVSNMTDNDRLESPEVSYTSFGIGAGIGARRSVVLATSR